MSSQILCNTCLSRWLLENSEPPLCHITQDAIKIWVWNTEKKSNSIYSEYLSVLFLTDDYKDFQLSILGQERLLEQHTKNFLQNWTEAFRMFFAPVAFLYFFPSVSSHIVQCFVIESKEQCCLTWMLALLFFLIVF